MMAAQRGVDKQAQNHSITCFTPASTRYKRNPLQMIQQLVCSAPTAPLILAFSLQSQSIPAEHSKPPQTSGAEELISRIKTVSGDKVDYDTAIDTPFRHQRVPEPSHTTRDSPNHPTTPTARKTLRYSYGKQHRSLIIPRHHFSHFSHFSLQQETAGTQRRQVDDRDSAVVTRYHSKDGHFAQDRNEHSTLERLPVSLAGFASRYNTTTNNLCDLNKNHEGRDLQDSDTSSQR